MPGGDIRLRQGTGTSPGHEGAGQGQILDLQRHTGDVLHKQHHGWEPAVDVCKGCKNRTAVATQPLLLAAQL